MKLNLLVQLEYDDALIHGDDPESVEWFRGVILNGTKGLLILHSNEIGDAVGTINVLEIQQ